MREESKVGSASGVPSTALFHLGEVQLQEAIEPREQLLSEPSVSELNGVQCRRRTLSNLDSPMTGEVSPEKYVYECVYVRACGAVLVRARR